MANQQLITLGVQLGKFTIEDIVYLQNYISLSIDDFKKIIKFKKNDWDQYTDYKYQDITSNMEQNELFDKMIKCENDDD